MKLRFSNITLIVGGLLAAGSNVFSTPIQRSDVAAEPAWVVHVDCDGLRQTTIGQYVLSELDKPDAQAKIAAFQTIFNLDPRKQVHGLTLYSTGQSPQDGVLLLYADFDADRLLTLAKAAKDYQSTSHNQHTIHSWSEDNKHFQGAAKGRTYAAIHSGRVIVFAQREAKVGQAMDVLDHSAPNLASSALFPHLGESGQAAFVQAAARKLDVPGTDPSAQLFKLTKLARLQLGEDHQQFKLTVNLEANSEEVAKTMSSIVEGLVSLSKLQTDKPEAAKLANALSFKQQGVELTATLQLPAADIVDMMKADAGRQHERRREKSE